MYACGCDLHVNHIISVTMLCIRNTLLFHVGMHTVSLDVQEFSSKPFQRAYQYLKCYESDATLLDKFTYKSVVEGRSEECLELLLRYACT